MDDMQIIGGTPETREGLVDTSKENNFGIIFLRSPEVNNASVIRPSAAWTLPVPFQASWDICQSSADFSNTGD